MWGGIECCHYIINGRAGSVVYAAVRCAADTGWHRIQQSARHYVDVWPTYADERQRTTTRWSRDSGDCGVVTNRPGD